MLFKHDATYYANQVKKGDISVTELVQASLENIKNLNPKLNAVTSVQESYALNLANEMDEHLVTLSDEEKEALPPFYGVPILLKDLGQNQKGMVSTSGSKLFSENVALENDHFTESIINAGFVILGRTNVPEFGFKGISDSQTTGPVQSPFKTGYNPGGSSGGAAAAVKAGIVPIATASDGGGSIRIPANYSGLIGLKPSRGRIKVGPMSYRSWQGASINFAITKSVADTWSLLKAIQVEQYESPFMIPKIKESELTTLDRPLRIAYSLNGSFTDNELPQKARTAILDTKDKLEKMGHKTVEAAPEVDNVKYLKSYYVMNSVESSNMIQNIEKGLNRSITIDDVEPLTWLMAKAGDNVLATDLSQIFNLWDQLTVKTESFFDQYDALVLPVAEGPAPKQGQLDANADVLQRIKSVEELNPKEQQNLIWEYFDKSQTYMGFNAQINLTGQPSIALPTYQDEDGWPIGVQIWTRKGNEYLLLQLTKQFEDNGFLNTEIVKVNE